MNTHTHTLIRFALLSVLTFGAAALCAPALAGAQQQIPWVGLAAPGAQLLEEVGPGHHGPGPADHFGFAVAAGDFNNDGYDDLATGIPGNDCDFVVWDCGSVQVRFGFPIGTLQDGVRLDPAHPDAPEPANAFDEYGRALAAGDFDNDGYDDLAVGIPGDLGTSSGETMQLGAIQIHYGLPAVAGSIQPAAEHFFHQPTAAWGDEQFGQALAVGDFDGNGHDDLAIGAPQDWRFFVDPSLDFQAEDIEAVNVANTGAVSVVPGRLNAGLTGAPRQLRPSGGGGRHPRLRRPGRPDPRLSGRLTVLRVGAGGGGLRRQRLRRPGDRGAGPESVRAGTDPV